MNTPQPAAPPSTLDLFVAFSLVGLTSFGGGLSGRMMVEFVQRRRWIDEEAFLNGLALSQALPGVNVANLSIWIGYRLRGLRGAFASFCGMIVPSAAVIVLLGVLFAHLTQFPVTHAALAGAAAAAIGLSLAMAVTTVQRLRRRAFPYVVTVLTFLAVAWLQWSIVWIVLGGGCISVAVEYLRLRREARGGGG
ncbi:MAG: chromate transporter [Proteobacteria bacterium]|nr:chromate transporter [Pseudomonadota bacterium]